ncbi:DUF975 family protein [Streptococcus pluranimalium]|uniref:DUF975 family protein n=1 Tax=Streptococcus pluranimalium TaxID=82348 RepID=UPI003BF89812
MIRSIKQQAKVLVKGLPGKYSLFILPIILSIVNITISYRETTIDSIDAQVSLSATIFPPLVTFLIAFFTISALYTMLEVVRQERKAVEFGDLMQSFSGGRFAKLFVALLVRNLLLLPWTFLMSVGLGIMFVFFIASFSSSDTHSGLLILLIGSALAIAGIILTIWKSLQYSQTEFVIYDQIAQNRYQGPLAAIKESKQLMKGHVFELFKLYLSFIGWYLLTFLTLGLVSIYLIPYITTTRAVYYQYLLEQNGAPTTEYQDGPIQESPFDVR